MNIVLLQLDIQWNNPEANIAKAEALMRQMPGADLYVLPEMWATGFATSPEGIAEDETSALSLQWMRKTAHANGCALAGSLAMRVADGSFRNRHYFITPDGESYYEKHHLFTPAHEDNGYVAGTSRMVASWKEFRFLLHTCYDLRFPVWARYSTGCEYDVILLVANWPAKRQDAWDVLTRARAIENQCYVIAVNRVGDDEAGHYDGGSVVIDPIGKTVACANANAEQPVSAVLSIETLQKRRNHFRVLDDRDNYQIV